MSKVLTRIVSHREFLKICGLAIVGAGASQVLVPPQPALAADGNFDNLYVTGQAHLATAGGNVGIGTPSPGDKLEVAGVVTSAMPGSGYWYAGVLHLKDTSNGKIWQLTNRGSLDTGNQNKLLTFYYDGASWLPRMTIDTIGNVGIGTTSPQAKLHLDSGEFRIGSRTIADSEGCYYA